MEEKEKFLSKDEKKELLQELTYLLGELAGDEFVYLYRALKKLQRRFDAIDEAFNRFCDKHNIKF